MKRRILIFVLVAALVLAMSMTAAFAGKPAPSPTVSITSPANNATVSGSAVAISADCSSGGTSYTVTGVTYSIDSGAAVAMTGPNGSVSGTWTASWDSTKVSDGSHTITVTATNSGNKSTSSSVTVTVSNGGSGNGIGNAYTVIAYNDLGMHCACPNNELMILLPPFNTIRAQVIKRGSIPQVITSGITVEYDSVENTEANLLNDSEYVKWLDNAEHYFPGCGISRTNIVGLTGNHLDGQMKPSGIHWVADGIPNYPNIDPNGILDFFGQKRDPYLTANITVKDTAGTVLAKTSTVVPVSFGGCCNCHYKLAQNVLGISNPTPDQSFKVMCDAHYRDHPEAGDIYAMKPIRCSKCHADPAVGAPGSELGVPTSTTFSEALHLFHAKSALVTSSTYDPNINTNCYDCHPDNNLVKCYRGLHQNSSLGLTKWCTDCHGSILNRIDRTDYKTPWQYNSLPTCKGCHGASYGENARSSSIFGLYLSSNGHKKDEIDCLTCHGSPHAEIPATNPYANDNGQSIQLQGTANGGKAIGVCDVCHIGRSTTWAVPPH